MSLVAVGIQLACGFDDDDAVGFLYAGPPVDEPARRLSLSIWISENPEKWKPGCPGGMDAFRALSEDETRPAEQCIEQLYTDCGLERFGFDIGAWQKLDPVDAVAATVLAGMLEAADPAIRTRMLELLFFAP